MPEQPAFKPGFRFSKIGACFIILAIVVASSLWQTFSVSSILIIYVVSHFFLFCNVIRMARVSELIWAAWFVVLYAGSIFFDGIQTWHAYLASVGLTLAMLPVEVCKPNYHGVFWRYFNPTLEEKFKSGGAH